MNVIKTIDGVCYLLSGKQTVRDKGMHSGDRVEDLAADRVITRGIHDKKVDGTWCDVDGQK